MNHTSRELLDTHYLIGCGAALVRVRPIIKHPMMSKKIPDVPLFITVDFIVL